MRTTTRSLVAFLAIWFLLAPGYGPAQENSEVAKAAPAATPVTHVQTGPFYRLDFVVKEVDANNKTINARSYSTSISHIGSCSIRSGARVPMSAGPGSQFQTFDLGTNFDCRQAQDVGGKLALRVITELSTVAPNDQEGAAKSQPVVRQNKWDADVIVPLGKPTTIFSSDDVSSKSRMQVELTATLIK